MEKGKEYQMVAKALVGEAEAPQISRSNALTENAGKTAPSEIIDEISAPPAQTTIDPGPVPMWFNAEMATEALRGRSNAMILAFWWGDSRQGTDYWTTQYDLLARTLPLSPEAAAILRAWIEQVEGAKK